jgi:hypothetical protein
MIKQKFSKEDKAFFNRFKRYYLSHGLKWTREHQESLIQRIDEQKVFEDARKELKYCFGLDLSLSQQIELKRIYVPETMKEYKMRGPFGGLYCIAFPEREAAARFMVNNFSLSLEHIERTINDIGSLRVIDPTAHKWIQHQQYEMLKL